MEKTRLLNLPHNVVGIFCYLPTLLILVATSIICFLEVSGLKSGSTLYFFLLSINDSFLSHTVYYLAFSSLIIQALIIVLWLTEPKDNKFVATHTKKAIVLLAAPIVLYTVVNLLFLAIVAIVAIFELISEIFRIFSMTPASGRGEIYGITSSIFESYFYLLPILCVVILVLNAGLTILTFVYAKRAFHNED